MAYVTMGKICGNLMSQKIQLGQFFTQKNIFSLPGFKSWWDSIPVEKKETVLEPYAGANNIIKSLQQINLITNYASFDIEPKEESVICCDTFAHFPQGYSCVVTNPPYLSKNSATKKKFVLDFPDGFQDLYEIALEKCLRNVEYVAAIIPESFLTTPRLKQRLHSVISLAYDDMFFDTEHPVCLAMFSPQTSSNFTIYKNEDLIGDYNTLKQKKQLILSHVKKASLNVKFNIPTGNIHILAVDNNHNASGIYFTTNEVVDSSEIKISSRARTRAYVVQNNETIVDIKLLTLLCERANELLGQYRSETCDVFMTSFKGLRKDGFYRRRLDFETAKHILLTALENINEPSA